MTTNNIMKLQTKKGVMADVRVLSQKVCIKDYFDAEKGVKTKKHALVSKVLFRDGTLETPLTLMLMVEKDSKQEKHLFYQPYNSEDSSLHTLVHSVSNEQARQLAKQLASACNFIR